MATEDKKTQNIPGTNQPVFDLNQFLAAASGNPQIIQAFASILSHFSNKVTEEDNDKAQLLERKRTLSRQLALESQRKQDELETIQAMCLHLKENGQESAVGGQKTHQPGHYIIGCCQCGKVFERISDIPLHILNTLDEDEIGGPVNNESIMSQLSS